MINSHRPLVFLCWPFRWRNLWGRDFIFFLFHKMKKKILFYIKTGSTKNVSNMFNLCFFYYRLNLNFLKYCFVLMDMHLCMHARMHTDTHTSKQIHTKSLMASSYETASIFSNWVIFQRSLARGGSSGWYAVCEFMKTENKH